MDNHSPLISVIIPTYNRPETLGTSLAGVLQQSLENLEIVVINDGGSPVETTVDALQDPRVRLIELGSNQGVSAARNAGIEAARGEYLAFIDDDDLVYPSHFEQLLACIRGRPEKVVYSDIANVTMVMKDGELVEESREVRMSRDFNLGTLFLHNLAPLNSYLIAREVVGETRFDTTLETHEDWYFLIQLAKRTAFHHLAEVTGEYRALEGRPSLSKNLDSMLSSLREVYARTESVVAGHPVLVSMRRQMEEDLRARADAQRRKSSGAP